MCVIAGKTDPDLNHKFWIILQHNYRPLHGEQLANPKGVPG